jgi:hypothetical protein
MIIYMKYEYYSIELLRKTYTSVFDLMISKHQ